MGDLLMGHGAFHPYQAHTSHPASGYPTGDSAACPIAPTPFVGERLSDEAREAAILMAGKLVERHMADHAKYLSDYDITNCFADKGAADGARLKAEEAARLMAELIKGRSAEVTAQFAREAAEGSVA